MLEHGANAEIWNVQGKTAMMLAMERGLEDMVRVLEKAADRSMDDEDEDDCDLNLGART